MCRSDSIQGGSQNAEVSEVAGSSGQRFERCGRRIARGVGYCERPAARRNHRHGRAARVERCKTRRSPSWLRRRSRSSYAASTTCSSSRRSRRTSTSRARAVSATRRRRSKSAASAAAAARPASAASASTSTTSSCRGPQAPSCACSTSSASRCCADRRARCSAATARAAPFACSRSKPGPERDGYLKLTLGNFDHQDFQGMINLPLGDELYLRAPARLPARGRLRDVAARKCSAVNEDTIARVQLGWHPSDTLTSHVGAMHTDSESDGSPTDMTLFNMDPICPLDPADTTYCLQGNYADWVSDFLETSGQERLAAKRRTARRSTTTRCRTGASSTTRIPIGTICAGSGTKRNTRKSTRTSTGRSPTA